MTIDSESKSIITRARKMAREPKADPAHTTLERTTKSELVIAMLSSEGGANLNELIAATGWLPHSARAALTGLKQKGHNVTSEKFDGIRRYRIDGRVA